MRNLRSILLASPCLLLALLPASLAENWPQFRGPRRDAISTETGLLRAWPEGGPKQLWQTEVCQGYAGAAIYDGRVFFNDYDIQTSEWLVRCLTLDQGKELWRYRDAKRIRPNHGITRTVPAVDGKYVLSLDPKCVFHCLDADSGKELWRKDLPTDYKTMIPPWYAGQCPLIESDRVIIAPAGSALLVALDKATGKPIWETPNPQGLAMSHASVMPAVIDNVKQYLYCTLTGVLGVSADDGRLLWSFPWKFNVAVPTSPLPIGDGRVFLTSCYEAETVMIRVKLIGDRWEVEKLFSLPARDWNSEVHTPILHQDHLFAVGKKSRGLFSCLDLDGNRIWSSEGQATFGLGSYLLADGMFFALEGDTGMLRLIEATTKAYKELAKAQVLSGHDVWGPMALSEGKLVLRDMRKMVCIEVGSGRQLGLAPR